MNDNVNMFMTLGIIVLLLFFVGMNGCHRDSDVTTALDDAGMHDVHSTGFRFFGCDKHDWYTTGFEAKNANGKVVTGVVCSGLFFKGKTVRYD